MSTVFDTVSLNLQQKIICYRCIGEYCNCTCLVALWIFICCHLRVLQADAGVLKRHAHNAENGGASGQPDGLSRSHAASLNPPVEQPRQQVVCAVESPGTSPASSCVTSSSGGTSGPRPPRCCFAIHGGFLTPTLWAVDHCRP
jgi:hypothetical protein